MKTSKTSFWLLFASALLSTLSLIGQEDCSDAVLIAGNADFNFTSNGAGINDFTGGSSDGCLSGEHNSTWAYFEFSSKMPANTSFEFTLHPNNLSDDYDFAVWGPDVACGSLGAPIRCTFAAPAGSIGLMDGAGDNSEGAGGNGFVEDIIVNPGERYYLMIDNWSSSSSGFSIDWGGDAVSYMNWTCEAPSINDAEVCSNETLFLPSLFVGDVYGGTWSGQGVSGDTFDPTGLEGSVAVVFSAGGCIDPVPVIVTVSEAATMNLGTLDPMCSDDAVVDLTALQDPNFPNGIWSGTGVSGTNFNPAGLGGDYTLTYTTDNPCVQPGLVFVQVGQVGTPNLATATLCETDQPLDLTTLEDPNFQQGIWTGAGVNNNTFNPDGLDGMIQLSFNPDGACSNSANTNVEVLPIQTPNLGNIADQCSNSPSVDLIPIQDPNFSTGTWSGTGVTGTSFNPNNLDGDYALTFTSDEQCVLPASTFVNVGQEGTPELEDAHICENDSPLNLNTLEDSNFPNGTWSGQGVNGDFFNPASLDGPIGLIFNPSSSCAEQAATIVTVVETDVLDLGATAACDDDAPIDLRTLTDPHWPNGTWSGTGISGNFFFPNSAAVGTNTITFNPTNNCVSANNTTIEVDETQMPALGMPDMMCNSDEPLDLTSLQDPNFPNGVWSGNGVSGSIFNPENQSGTITLTFTPTGVNCSQPANVQVEVAGNTPTFSNQNHLLGSSINSIEDGAIDMNGDFLDDVVRIQNNGLYIDYQQPDGSFIHQAYPISFSNTPGWSLCAGDIDNNGYNDLLFGGSSRVSFIYANATGTGYTEDFHDEYIFSQRSTFADIDNDGHLDAFVCHDVDQSHPYRNDGSGNLVLDQTLITTADMPGNYAAIWVDYDNDRDIDLYITKCKLGSTPGDIERTNLLYQNNGDGTFTEVGATANMNDNSQSWATVFEDFDNDGDFDAFIVNHDFANRFMRNNGDGTFTDIIGSTGIPASDLGAWENASGDFNNDGFVDIFSELESELFLNNGDLTFTAVELPFDDGGIGDFNNDGCLDIIDGPNLWLNDGNCNNWVKINTIGTESNKNGIGARVEIHGDWGMQIREVRAGQSFAPMSSLNTHFGIGTAESIDQIVVKWPSGQTSTLNNPAINTTHQIVEGATTLAVEGIVIEAVAMSDYIQLNWQIQYALGLSHYEIERSLDGISFEKIGVQTSSNRKTYQWKDEKVQANINYYYRLKLIEDDNQSEYSKVVSASLKKEQLAEVYLSPNPSKENTRLVFKSIPLEPVSILLYNTLGQTIETYRVVNTQELSMDLSGLESGIYWVQLSVENESKTLKLVKE